MRARMVILCAAVICCMLAALAIPSQVALAVDAVTDNTTLPDSTDLEPSLGEITPQQECVRLGPTVHQQDSPPAMTLKFRSTSAEDNFQVTADENWYLEIDINAAGWLYIYEYYPSGGALPGKWIAYKWELPQGAIWQLGPFSPGSDMLQGQHIYRAWFYSEEQWSDENPDTSQGNLIFWTYQREQAVPVIEGTPAPPPAEPVEEKSFLKKLQGFITDPLTLALSPLLLFLVVIPYVFRENISGYIRRFRGNKSLSAEKAPVSPLLPAAPCRAKISLPNGAEIAINGDGGSIGRVELARALGLDGLSLISRQHFQISAVGVEFYIEDLGSANGTRLNDEDISGKGPVILSHDDIIQPAGAVSLKFQLL